MKKVITLVIGIVLIMSLLCGCSAETDNKGMAYEDTDMLMEEADMLTEDVVESETVTSRKLIKDVSLTVETKDYDNYIKNLRNKVASNGGYIESSEEYNDSEFRTFDVTIRIPVEETDSFTDFASNNATVTSRSENIKDVTEQYVDIEARIKVYKAEEESLIEIMKQADNVTDLLVVKEQLADLRAEIESYTAQLKSLENKTSYSTITLTVYEVEREVKTEGYWSKIWNNVIKGFENIGTFMKTLFAISLSAIPYLLIPAVIAVIIIVVIRLLKKRKNLNKNDK